MADDPFAQYAVKSDPFAAYATDAGVPTVHASDMLTRRGIGNTSMDPATDKPDQGFLAGLVQMMEPSAHPTSVADFSPLAIGSVGTEAVPSMIRAYLRAGKQAVAEAPNLRSIPKLMIKSLYQAATDTQQPGVRAFNELPLAKQMEGLPLNTAAVGREAGAPFPLVRESRFTDKPLALQMDQLPQRGAASARTPTPVYPPQGTVNDLPLAVQMNHLPTTGGVASSRGVIPQTIQQARFNDLPLAQQMEHLPTTGPIPERGPMPQPPLRIASPVPDSALSDADFAAKEAAAGRLDPSIAARIKQQSQFGQRPTLPKIQVDPASVPQTYRTSGSSALAPEPVAPPTSQPLGQPRVMTLKETPTSWTPEAARARIENSQWESGLEPGSAEAQAVSGYHKYDAEMSSRLKFLMENPNAALALGSGGALLREAILSRLRGGLASSAEPTGPR